MSKFNKKLKLERHRYAPELNKLHIAGKVFPVPGCTTIKDAKHKLGLIPAKTWLRIVSIRIGYFNEDLSSQTNITKALADNHNEILHFLKVRREYHCLPFPKTETIKTFAPEFR